MNPTQFLYRAATGKSVQPGAAVCCLCGLRCGGAIPVEAVIKDTFTNHGLCRVPSSKVACEACDHYFNYRWDAGQKYESEYRKHSMKVFADRWEDWDRKDMAMDIAEWVLRGCPECVLVVGLSKKKHCLPLAVVNPPGKSFVVQVEESRVMVTQSTWISLKATFEELMGMGCHKGEIMSGNYYHATLKKVGVSPIMKLDRVIAPHRPSDLLTLVSYVTVVEEDDAD